MSRIDLAVSLFWLLLGLTLCWGSVALGVAGPGGPGSGLFPLLAGLLIAGGGAALLLRHAVTGGAAAPGEERAATFWPDAGAPRRAITLILVVMAMILAVPHLSFALSGLVGLPLLYRLIAPGSSWIAAVASGGIAAALIHVLFAVLLGTPLPRGPLGF
jgi:hypothetical protein